MNKQKKMVIGVILVVILLLAVGYAAVSNISLTISGTATAVADQDNFKVYFTAENTVEAIGTTTTSTAVASATVTAKATTATVDITGLSKKGDTGYVILEIENGSNDVDASSINVNSVGTNSTNITITSEMCDSTGTAISNYAVASGAKTYVKVTATLNETVVVDESATIAVTILAEPAGVSA